MATTTCTTCSATHDSGMDETVTACPDCNGIQPTMKINLTPDAIDNARESGADIEGDVAAIRSGEHTRESLLAYCLDGADADRVEGWHEYVSAVCDAAGVEDVTVDGD